MCAFLGMYGHTACACVPGMMSAQGCMSRAGRYVHHEIPVSLRSRGVACITRSRRSWQQGAADIRRQASGVQNPVSSKWRQNSRGWRPGARPRARQAPSMEHWASRIQSQTSGFALLPQAAAAYLLLPMPHSERSLLVAAWNSPAVLPIVFVTHASAVVVSSWVPV